MELAELERRLGPFCEAMYETDSVRVFDVHKMPGHAGFSYGFSVAAGRAQRRLVHSHPAAERELAGDR